MKPWTNYDLSTRILHLAIAVGITAQMFASLVMIHPKPGRPANAWFEVHETLGLILFAALLAHWLWSLVRTAAYGEPMLLFPWASRTHLRALADDLRATVRELTQRRLPKADRPLPLPAAIQGLGLLLGLFLAGSGLAMYLGMEPDGRMTGWLRGVKEAHEAAAPLMWAFLAVHPTLGILHHLAGHGTLSRMFGFIHRAPR